MSEKEVIYLAVALFLCALNYYVGKAKGRDEERKRIFEKDGE